LVLRTSRTNQLTVHEQYLTFEKEKKVLTFVLQENVSASGSSSFTAVQMEPTTLARREGAAQ